MHATGIPDSCCSAIFDDPPRSLVTIFYMMCCQPPDDRARQQFAELFIRALANTILDSGAVRYPPALRRAIAFCRTQRHDLPSVGAIANSVGVSTPTLTRLFRSHLDCSPKQWLLNNRLNKAKRMIVTTDLAIAEIARLSGFQDPLYFSKLCRSIWLHRPIFANKVAGNL